MLLWVRQPRVPLDIMNPSLGTAHVWFGPKMYKLLCFCNLFCPKLFGFHVWLGVFCCKGETIGLVPGLVDLGPGKVLTIADLAPFWQPSAPGGNLPAPDRPWRPMSALVSWPSIVFSCLLLPCFVVSCAGSVSWLSRSMIGSLWISFLFCIKYGSALALY